MAPDAALVVRDVEMRFGAVRALKGVSLEVPQGSLCGLVGPNGAGKTTTMRILATDLDPTDGEVRVLGSKLPHGAASVRRRLGYMPDNVGLYEELTLREYLQFFAAFYGFRGAARRDATDTALALAGVGALAERRLGGLSKGERQRVLLARTLIHDPDLLVLDEPADGLDPRGRVELRELLSLLHERGKTILISSHILVDLEEICTDFVFIDHGRVVLHGSREQLLRDREATAIVRIEAIEDVARLTSHLAAVDGVTVLGCEAGVVEITVPGDPRFSQDLLARLVAAGIPVVSFARSRESLEAIYLRTTSHPREDG